MERSPEGRGRGVWFVAALVLVAGAAGFGYPMVRVHLQALAVLDQVSGTGASRVLQHLVTEPVSVCDVTIPTEGAPIRARLYAPVPYRDGPALIVLHGVHHLGVDEPRLIGFARAMASCGLRVLTPELPGIKDYHVDRGSIRTIGEATRWFAVETGQPVGVMGLSFSGGLALVAAADPVFHPAFKFVMAVGSQDSMSRVAAYYRTGEDRRPNGSTELLPAHEYGPLVLEYEHLEDFVPTWDVAAVRAALRAHLYEDPAGEAAAVARLSAVERGEYAKLLATGSEETMGRIRDSSAKHAAEMAELSPRGRLAQLAMPVYLLHGEGDNIIPAAETLWMASELAPESLQAVLVSPVISHLDVSEAKPSVLDRWRLVHFFARVLLAADSQTGRA